MQTDLQATIAEIREKVEDERAYYQGNEAAVRNDLINDLLKVLGWKVGNSKFVRLEQRNDDGGIPDYTLLKEGKQILVVEAKKLSVDVRDTKVIAQLTKYVYPIGIEFGIITNGLQWLLFNTFSRNPNERTEWVIDLDKPEEDEVSIKHLQTLAYDRIEQLEEYLKTGKVLSNFWDINFQSPTAVSGFLAKVVKDPLEKRTTTIG